MVWGDSACNTRNQDLFRILSDKSEGKTTALTYLSRSDEVNEFAD